MISKTYRMPIRTVYNCSCTDLRIAALPSVIGHADDIIPLFFEVFFVFGRSKRGIFSIFKLTQEITGTVFSQTVENLCILCFEIQCYFRFLASIQCYRTLNLVIGSAADCHSSRDGSCALFRIC